MKVLSGDIGGTKVNLGVFEVKNQQVHSIFELSFASRDYNSLEEIIALFLIQYKGKDIISASFGVAGPVINNRSDITNLPWIIDAEKIQHQFGWQVVSLINDLEANAWGISSLDESDYIILNQGTLTHNKLNKTEGNASIIAAGTGLGEAGLFWTGQQHIPFASEGGHTNFCPATEKEFRLYQFLSKKYNGHVSWERIVSGMGLENLYLFLCHEDNIQPPPWLTQEMAIDAAAAISKAAIGKKDKRCQQALDWFVYLYGVEAGNHALKIMSKGGVYLGGGIAPKIINQLQSGGFMRGFCDKGRMQHLLKAMPVKVIMNEKTALYGPALYAENKS